MSKELGIVLYRGPSQLDGKLIVCIATGFSGSKNVKTGNLIQTWIMRADIDPLTVHANNWDESICGQCFYKNTDSCYVNIGQAPYGVYMADCRRRYVEFDYNKHKDLFINRSMRIGSYGDPTSVPVKVWQQFLPLLKGFSGYSHQWRNPKFQDYKHFCMASLEKPQDYDKAKKLGWRTFRVKPLSSEIVNKNLLEPKDENGEKDNTKEDFFQYWKKLQQKGYNQIFGTEILCRASDKYAEMYEGKKLTCEQCGLCCGDKISGPDIVIDFHGFGPNSYKYKNFVKCLSKIEGKKGWKKPDIKKKKRKKVKKVVKKVDNLVVV